MHKIRDDSNSESAKVKGNIEDDVEHVEKCKRRRDDSNSESAKVKEPFPDVTVWYNEESSQIEPCADATVLHSTPLAGNTTNLNILSHLSGIDGQSVSRMMTRSRTSGTFSIAGKGVECDPGVTITA